MPDRGRLDPVVALCVQGAGAAGTSVGPEDRWAVICQSERQVDQHDPVFEAELRLESLVPSTPLRLVVWDSPAEGNLNLVGTKQRVCYAEFTARDLLNKRRVVFPARDGPGPASL